MNRDIDSARRARKLTTLSYSLPGGIIGLMAGLYGAYMDRWSVLVGVVVGVSVGFLVVFVISTLVTERAGTLAGAILLPSGKSTPVKREYSYPQSLAARGHYEDAINAYQVCCTDHPDDPEPYVRIARLYRDNLERYDEALFWFRRARSESVLTSGRELLITREIIEVYTHRTGNPRKAIPELARLVDRFPDDPISEWAKTQIVTLKGERERGEQGFRD